MSERNSNRLKVLHLVRWYPNRWDPMPGLFIQRHAEAANLFCDVGVVYTHQVEDQGKIKSKFEIDYCIINGVPTAKVYYSSAAGWGLPINKTINIFRFFKANIIGIKRIKAEIGNFDLIHIHILTRLGLIGLYHKFIHKKPYIITEHWSRYLDLTDSFNGTIRKFVSRVVVKNAACVTAVTENLAKAMHSHGLLNNNYLVLPNVVDEKFLFKSKPDASLDKQTTFLHVSCFEDKSKNISGLLRVISKLSKIRNDFIFRLVGDGMDMHWLLEYARELDIDENKIVFTGLLEGNELVNEMSIADMLVIFSNYENFPVVINESLSLGIPVVATKVGGIPERINERNGVLVDAGSEDQLQATLIDFMDGKLIYDMVEIQKQAKNEFSPESIGKILYGLYENALA